MLTMTECHRTNLCIDCDDPHCSGAGNAEADCPLWVCKHPDTRCEDCDILREYVEAYRKEGDTIGQNMDTTGKR